MTRFAWITPGYPPARGGVSDHSGAMVSELRAHGDEALVCSNPQEIGFRKLDAELAAFRPEAIVVAYVPLGFAPHTGGLSPSFAAWCTRLARLDGVSKLLLAHEVNLPVAVHWRRHEPKLALLGLLHMAQFQLIARGFDTVAFSHEGNRSIWMNLLPGLRGHLQTIRICSSIAVAESVDPRAELVAAGYRVCRRPIVFFGTGHDSVLVGYLEAALAQLLKVDPDLQLVIVGMNEPTLRSIRPSLATFGSSVQALGFVPARQVSLWLQVAELVLAPLAEGVNARKTTVMAAFQHARAVVTTRGFHTREDIPWSRICALTPLDPDAFASVAARAFTDPEWRVQLGDAARADYLANASPQVTAARLRGFIGRE